MKYISNFHLIYSNTFIVVWNGFLSYLKVKSLAATFSYYECCFVSDIYKGQVGISISPLCLIEDTKLWLSS